MSRYLYNDNTIQSPIRATISLARCGNSTALAIETPLCSSVVTYVLFFFPFRSFEYRGNELVLRNYSFPLVYVRCVIDYQFHFSPFSNTESRLTAPRILKDATKIMF